MEHDVEHPVQAVFDMPVASDGIGEQLGIERHGGQVIAPFEADAAVALDFGLDPCDGAQAWVLRPPAENGGNIAFSAGLKLPTGINNGTGAARLANGTIQKVVADQSMQPGDGSWGFTLGSQAYKQTYFHTIGYFQGSWLFNPRDTNGVPTFRSAKGEDVMSVTDQYLFRAGLSRHAGLFALYVLSNDFWTGEHWRALGFSSPEDFVIGFLEAYFQPMDAGALLAMAWKWQHGDVSRHTGGDLAAALGRITATTFVMPISTDKFFPPEDCAAEQALIPGSELRVIEDLHGHASLFGLTPSYVEQVDSALRDLLATDA